MSPVNVKHPKIIKKIEAFSAIVRRFCSMIESYPYLSQYEMLRGVNELLPQLYIKVLELPNVDQGDKIPPAKEPFINENLKIDLQFKFGRYDNYWQIPNVVMQEKPIPIHTSLAQNLLILYAAIKLGLELVEKQTDINIYNGIWVWKYYFKNRWGTNVVDAHRITHHLLNEHFLKSYSNL